MQSQSTVKCLTNLDSQKIKDVFGSRRQREKDKAMAYGDTGFVNEKTELRDQLRRISLTQNP